MLNGRKCIKANIARTLIALVLIFVMSTVAIFAEDPDPNAGNGSDPGTTQDPGNTDPQPDPQPEPPVEIPAPASVSGLKALAGYDCVTLKWNAVANNAGANGAGIKYEVYRDGKLVKTVDKNEYIDKVSPRNGKDYVYRVVAVNYNVKQNNKKVSSSTVGNAPMVKKMPVRPMYVTATTKKKAPYYKTKKSSNVMGKLPKGQKLEITLAAYRAEKIEPAPGEEADTRVRCRYVIFVKGKKYFLPTNNLKNIKAHYSKKDIYTKEEKENFVNTWGVKSRKKYLVWISPYTQKVNIFKGSAGKWKLHKTFSCNTGKATSPTPLGKFAVKGRISSRNGLSYWTQFNIVAMHQKYKKVALGKPASGGCVRLKYADAKWVYKNIKEDTRVVVY